MKKLFVMMICVGLVFVSCNKEAMLETFGFGLEEDFQLNEEYQSHDNVLKFEIKEINDSRCPSDVVCVWEGKVDVKIEVEKPQSGTIVLNTYDNLADTVGNYSFTLVDVSPYPISTETTELEDYDVSLKIMKL